MTEWNYIETEYFVRSCEEYGISQDIKDFIEEWAKSVRRQITPSNKRPFISPNNIFEIWDARIPNPDANKGKSGGYRLVYYIHLSERNLFVDLMVDRKDLDYKGSNGKKQKKWDGHLADLKKELLQKYDNC
ncbi:TPA: hypothetical protein DCZ46_01530 [Candidatus Campbellbacteria bacterium]|nr:MAG: hypothetical protein UR58_C0001G0276 [Candidatus Campbellbacteria bacterium GW2011_OD1_34_28]KKP75237.1 MAG: hypothetical protein UR74_C0001G0093 [Candidatus Campbellbacteria bacterium GW2011_GWD2_35_24]KKP76202.1 MAG: hypothetical protein UR75_C0001G0236 [Candidatus Campbellbacteria bacterium GW2011_GWC2_35_28]KKP77391.1 MAG: hypothetical protein UR76_C0001G0236 [Candidatus Campbellbacteria bacterium GW2011_GWC1_35_31]KKP79320.1 MAG: hypothetical protein UR79_C0001G0236 [Candidatus Cam